MGRMPNTSSRVEKPIMRNKHRRTYEMRMGTEPDPQRIPVPQGRRQQPRHSPLVAIRVRLDRAPRPGIPHQNRLYLVLLSQRYLHQPYLRVRQDYILLGKQRGGRSSYWLLLQRRRRSSLTRSIATCSSSGDIEYPVGSQTMHTCSSD